MAFPNSSLTIVKFSNFFSSRLWQAFVQFKWQIFKRILLVVCLIALGYVAYQNLSHLEKNNFNPSTTSLYSTAPNAWIFRGNTPTYGIKFDYSRLMSTLRSDADRAKHPLPKHFKLVDISLLRNTWPLYEAIQVHGEISFFKQHPSLGKVINAPLTLARYKGKKLYKLNETAYAVSSISQSIASATETMPVIIYVHCEHGINRTGTVLASYSKIHELI